MQLARAHQFSKCVLLLNEVLNHLYTKLKASAHFLKTLQDLRGEVQLILAQNLQKHVNIEEA